MAALQLGEQGKLDLEAPLSRSLSALPCDARGMRVLRTRAAHEPGH